MDLNAIIDFYAKNSKILLQINNLIKKYENLNSFTKIELEYILEVEESDEAIFEKLLQAKVAAQTNLNILYNSHFYKKCFVLRNYLPYAGKENLTTEEVAILILRYIILYQHLALKETKTTKDDILEGRMILDPRGVQCSYCDTYNTLDKTKCEGCDDDLNDTRGRINNDDRGRINNDDRRRINNDDRGRINNDDRGRINNDDRRRINNDDIWICRHCTCNNSISNMCCITCGRDKVESSFIKDDNVKKERKRKKNQSDSTNTRDLHKLILEDKTLDTKINYPKIKNDHNVEQSINKWSCTFCTFKNEFSDINCGVCSNERIKSSITSERSDYPSFNNTRKVDNDIVKSEGGTWACPSCTFNNKLQNLCCEVCFTFKEVKVSSEDSDNEGYDDDDSSVKVEDGMKGTWQCIHCKEVNLYDKYTCGSCHKYAPFFKKWVCERCSFFNDEFSEYCKVCNEKNVHLKLCNKCKKMTKVSEGALCKGCKDNTSQSKEIIKEDDWKKVENKKGHKGNFKKEKESSDVSMKGKYYCNNRWCGNINNNNLKHCSKCKLKKEANITFFNTAEVFNGNTYIKMWQCTFCGDFNTKGSCGKCKNLRHSSSYKKCSQCNWVNKNKDRKCNKCLKILSSLR